MAEAAVSEVAVLPESTERTWIEPIWRFFCSLKLTLANLLGLFLAMVAGTFVNPSNAPLTEIQSAFRDKPLVLAAYKYFELYDLFHAWWFTLLLLSLALNLIACSIERLPRIWYLVRDPEKRLDRVKGLRMRMNGAGDLAALSTDLKERGYAVQTAERDGGIDLFAERGRYSRFGVWVVHLSLLIVLGGGIVGRLTAFEGTALIGQGDDTDSFLVRSPDGTEMKRKLGFIVRCDDFRLKEFEPGRPKSYESDLRIFERLPDGSAGRELAKQTIAVNTPLRHAGITLYQASYQQGEDGSRAAMTITDKTTGHSRQVMWRGGETVEVADGLTYKATDYQDDFAGQGPAVQLERSEDGHASTFWVFSKAPGFDARNRGDRFGFDFGGLRPSYATGLQIARDPSTPIVYLGCFFLFAGTLIAFATSHKRVWARAEGGQLSMGAAAHRNPDSFRREVEEVCAKIGIPLAPAQ
ncbi:MAG TPA: cytochrome c biogenesis protein ResB [Myxococcales bacterium]|nr:cytochrome c biogenesis protein ResB [Myxococcales bacterium]